MNSFERFLSNNINWIISSILGGMFLLIFLILVVWAPYACEERSKVIGMNHSWSFSTKCMVEYKPGKWILLRNLRAEED